VPAWQATPGFQIVAAVDPAPEQRAQLQALLPAVRCYERLETLLAQEEVDFLDVCTPPAFHETGILQACAHGVHVLCEKPLTCTAEAMQHILAAVAKAQVLLFAVHNWKYAPIVQTLKCLLSEGVIGTPTSIELTTLRTKPAGNTGWRLDPAMAGGGILFDHGWHAFYLLLFLLDARPQRIAATVERRLFLSAGVEDTVTCEVTFPHAQALVHLTWAATERTNRIVIHGDSGTIHVEDARLQIAPQGETPHEVVFPAALSAGSYHPDWFAAMLPDFQTALADQARWLDSLREAETCLHLILLAYRSAAAHAQALACTPEGDLASA
jgi:predicted dehydrogenase